MELRRFVLGQTQDIQPFKFLQSVDSPEISFLVFAPHEVYPDYRPQITEEARLELALEEGQQLAVYVIVTPAVNVAATTANLLAPVLINPHSMRGYQLIQEGSDYQVRQPLAQDIGCHPL